jgi:glycosyltransferase-like protein
VNAHRRPSVGLCTYSTAPRGSVVHTAALAEALTDAGWNATVYALDKDGAGFYRPLRAALRLVPAAPAPSSTAALVLQRASELAAYLVRRGRAPALFHAQDCLTANGLLLARARGLRDPASLPIPIVRTVHHVEAFDDAELARCQVRSIRDADAVLTVSRDTKREVADLFGIDSAVVGNGVDVDRWTRPDHARLQAWRARLGPAARPLILATGGVEPRKNTVRLLRAFARLRLAHPAARLWIVGGATVLDHGAYRAAYEAARAALEPDARAAVAELGVVDDADMVALFHLADVLALPSVKEGFGLTALEALAAGLPLVAAATPPFTEFLDRSCATLVDPRSEADIAAGLSDALGAPAARIAAGRRRAATHSWRQVAARHADHYQRTIAHARDALRRSLA